MVVLIFSFNSSEMGSNFFGDLFQLAAARFLISSKESHSVIFPLSYTVTNELGDFGAGYTTGNCKVIFIVNTYIILIVNQG